MAAARGLSISENRRGRNHASDSLALSLETEDGRRTAEGMTFADGSPRLISVDGIYVEVSLKGHMVFTKNVDVPGVIGRVGTILGDNQINIADFSLGRSDKPPGNEGAAEAVAVIRIDGPMPEKVLDELNALEPVRFTRPIELPE